MSFRAIVPCLYRWLACLCVCVCVRESRWRRREAALRSCVCEEAGCWVGWREGERVAWITQVRWEAWWQAWRQTRSCKHRRGDCSSPSAPEVVACRMTDTIGPVANRHSCVRLADCVLARAVCQTLRAQNSSYPYPACTSTAPFQPSREGSTPGRFAQADDIIFPCMGALLFWWEPARGRILWSTPFKAEFNAQAKQPGKKNCQTIA